MTKKTQAELEAEEQAKADALAEDAEFEASIADFSEEEQEAKRAEKRAQSSDSKIDYEAELEKERVAHKNAENALAKKRFEDAKKKREADEKNKDEEDEEQAVSRIQAETEKGLKQIQKNQASMIADRLASEPAEKALIIEKWKNRTFPTDMPLDEQIEETFAIVNRKKLIAERNEALRSLNGKETVNKDGSNEHHENFKEKEPKLNPDMKQVLVRRGFTYNQATKQYEKKLPNGQLMVSDGKQTWIDGVPRPQNS